MTENSQNPEEKSEKTGEMPANEGTENIRTNEKEKTETYQNVFPLKKDDPEWEKKKAFYRANLSEAFKLLSTGMRVTVTRTRPSWCARYIETIPVDIDEYGNPNIDMEFLKETYGGESLSLKFLDDNGNFFFGGTVHFRGVAPRESGCELVHPDIQRRNEEIRLEEKERLKQNQNLSEKLFDTVLTMQANNFQNMISLFQQNSHEKAPLNQFDEMLKTLERLDRFRNPNPPQIDTDNLGGMLSGLANMFFQKGAAPQNLPPYQNPHNASQVRMPMTAIPVDSASVPSKKQQTDISESVNNYHSESKIHPVNSENINHEMVNNNDDADGNDEEIDIVDELSEMSNEELSDTLAALMQQLGQERQTEIFKMLGKLAMEQNE